MTRLGMFWVPSFKGYLQPTTTSVSSMDSGLCLASNLWAFADPCIRLLWSALIPGALVTLIGLCSVPLPNGIITDVVNFTKAPFQPLVTLEEAEALNEVDEMPASHPSEAGGPVSQFSPVPLWRTVLLSWIALLETLVWLSLGIFWLVEGQNSLWYALSPIAIAITWLYAVVRPVARPTLTPPYDLFALFLCHWATSILLLGGVVYNRFASNAATLDWLTTAGLGANVTAVTVLLAIVLQMPLAIPSKRVRKEEIGRAVSPEDYTSLWGWLSFTWVRPIMKRGASRPLQEDDVWSLSPLLRSRPIFFKFKIASDTFKKVSAPRFLPFGSSYQLLRTILSTNSSDMLMSLTLTFILSFLRFSSPFFLKRILEAIDHPSRETYARAYVYAAICLVASLLEALLDRQRIWHSGRASTRVTSQLQAAIFDKSLKKKDFSGTVDKGKEVAVQEVQGEKVAASSNTNQSADSNAANKQNDNKPVEKDETKVGAATGKIMNIMSADVYQVVWIVQSSYRFCGIPMQLTIGCILLYQCVFYHPFYSFEGPENALISTRLLGWSAFVGGVVFVAGWPLNSFLTKRGYKISKQWSSEKDKRMDAVTELISAIKLIKFFAWDERWITRVLEAREKELQLLKKKRINGVMFYILWLSIPILFTFLSFSVFVAQGNQLTVPIAFTAITLFRAVQAALNYIPTFVVQLLQTKVALDRIANYLEEEEVSEEVSTLKNKNNACPGDSSTKPGLGIQSGYFRWNERKDSPEENGAAVTVGNEATASNEAVASDGTISNDEMTATEPSLLPTDSGVPRFELKDINVMFPERRLTLVTGPTASGKTALLMALLGELTALPGSCIIMSKDTSQIDANGYMNAISYAAQTPWIRHQSIKDNILFGSPLDEARYQQVIECCALKPDLRTLEDGDATEIGARGINLSGGQKARVSLARAVYAHTKYVLLDDPLSAVDSHTAHSLVDHLFCGPLLQNRTVILVTHHVDLVLPAAHYLIQMLDGRIDTQGTVKDLQEQGVLELTHPGTLIQTSEIDSVQGISTNSKGLESIELPREEDWKPRKLVQDEHRETGDVKWHIYTSYIKASSYWTWAILLLLLAVLEVIYFSRQWWLKIWGEAYGQIERLRVMWSLKSDFFAFANKYDLSSIQPVGRLRKPLSLRFDREWPHAQEHPYFYVAGFAAISLAQMTISAMDYAVRFAGSLRASRILFKRLLISVVHATMRWHDTTPQGRMLNRFAKDISTVDHRLADSLSNVNNAVSTFLSCAFIVIYFVPSFIFPAIIIANLFRMLAIEYLKTGRELRRMTSNARSPIFDGFGEMLDGIITVRAFSAEKRFLDDLHRKIDLMVKMQYTFASTHYFVFTVAEFLCGIAVFLTTFFALSGYVSAGIAGICISATLSFSWSMFSLCSSWTSLALELNALERVVEYLELPQEEDSSVKPNLPPAYWPSLSTKDYIVQVENLVIKYAPELPPVLRGISFNLNAGERIGVLGRTGSGKSTLAMSILRFVEPASGKIIIDGMEISTISLHDLRSRLTFIPQDAMLFSGTLRENLDPFEDHEDSECLDALYRTGLLSENGPQRPSSQPSRTPSIHGEEQGSAPSIMTSATQSDFKDKITLDTLLSPGGTNFSHGQRQLIAMARALLRRSSIVILDEATSSIDFDTDAKIQALIREEFSNSLLITIAHRLRTIIDYDGLLILENGELVEFDTPFNLIQKEGGNFRSMCLKSGDFAELETAAKAKAQKARS